jgi:nucleoside-diphosphate-sugar epimerase
MAPQHASQVVAVTGVSGYIGSEVVKQLLEKGYTVRGTVRSKSNTGKVQHLLTLSDALPGQLELFEADLLKAGDFDNVVRGADFVLHTASPFFTETSDPQKDLVDPAVNGTTNVLNAAGKAGIKRVVVTSSVAGSQCAVRTACTNMVLQCGLKFQVMLQL